VQKDRNLNLLDDHDLVMTQIISETKIVGRDVSNDMRLMASDITRKVLKCIFRSMNADVDEPMSYKRGIINQMLW
jgi:hypothetical protein